MNKNYEHITKMENIMKKQEESITKLKEILDDINKQNKDYKELFDYYYSKQRMEDLKLEEKHLIPENIDRGVLSEDGIYNLFLDTHDIALHMIESALKLLKIN